ncbi:tRNA (adenosine(37)-N6)-dimethylallyltransferase MiaA [Qipengyuania sp. JC766]|uniref:tRNA (adenosine(37)-N6)-dimethylallyltransferase MiaA n=1 Tax=Qipengyuania sp. JC766 TaxID=3232139 RepID=UPI00345A815D
MSTAYSPGSGDDPSLKKPLALIAGPTASGKSALAVDLALALQARGRAVAVVNADSAQVYADLAILSARPDESEMRGVPHLLFGAWDGADACSAAQWADAAKREIARLHADDAVPILCGGTGLYLRTLLDGIAPIPEIDPAVRTGVRALATADARTALEREDPQAAKRLSPNDTARTQRALEVVRSTKRTLAEWQGRKEGGIGDAVTLHPLILLPDREWLYERCDRRFGQMIDRGAIGEVEALLARKLDPALPVMRAIGVPELAGVLRGETTLEDAAEEARRATRNYAKRQFTWFRRQPPEDWPRIADPVADVEDLFRTLLN